MKLQVGFYEAKTKLRELLRGVQAGNRYTITVRGEPVADLVPTEGNKKADAKAVVEEMLRFMQAGQRVSGVAHPWRYLRRDLCSATCGVAATGDVTHCGCPSLRIFSSPSSIVPDRIANGPCAVGCLPQSSWIWGTQDPLATFAQWIDVMKRLSAFLFAILGMAGCNQVSMDGPRDGLGLLNDLEDRAFAMAQLDGAGRFVVVAPIQALQSVAMEVRSTPFSGCLGEARDALVASIDQIIMAQAAASGDAAMAEAWQPATAYRKAAETCEVVLTS